jgi:hypothetical protein
VSKLLLVSAKSSPSRINRFVRPQTDYNWIYAGHDIRLRIHWEKHLDAAQTRINMANELQRAADDLSEDFNEWIDDLGKTHNSLGWWIGQISEKNPFVSLLYFHICYLKIIIDKVKKSSTTNWMIVVESHGLRRALKLYAKSSDIELIEIDRWSSELNALKNLCASMIYGLWSRIALIRSWLALCRVTRELCNRHIQGDSAVGDYKGTVLFHSWLRDDSVNDCGEFVDRFFGILPHHLRKKGYEVKYFFLPLTIVVKQSLLYDLLKPLAESGLLFPSHLYLKVIDVLKAIFFPLIFCWLPRHVPKFRSYSVQHLVAEERLSQVWSSRTSAAYLYYTFAIRLSKDRRRFNKVLGTFENHIWEKALYLGMRQHDVADSLIGYQHTTLNWNYHCYSPKAFEFHAGVLPDNVICTGSVWAEELLRRGYTSVGVGGALRFDPLPTTMDTDHRSNNKPTILVASNAGESLTLEVLRNIYLAFGDDPDIKIWIKIHPHLHLTRSHFASVFDGNMPQHFYVKEESVPELLSNVDLLVYSSTSLCFEALSMGIQVLSVVPETFIDLDDLRLFPQLRCAAVNHEDLRAKAQKILGQSNDEYLDWLSNVKEPMKTVFTPVTSGTLEAFTVSEELSEK